MLNYILIASPDKISLSTFTNFIKKNFDYPVGILHNMMSKESINTYINDFSQQFPNGILTFYAKKALNVEPSTYLPQEVIKKVDVVVWFNLYSMDPIVVKDPLDQLKVILEDWSQFIKRIS